MINANLLNDFFKINIPNNKENIRKDNHETKVGNIAVALWHCIVICSIVINEAFVQSIIKY